MDWRIILQTIGLIALGLLFGCSTPKPAPVQERGDIPESYRVVWGDTLGEIALRFGLDYRQLATWNQLESPDRIYAGQQLRLRPSGSTIDAKPPTTRSTYTAQSISESAAKTGAPEDRKAPSGTRVVAQVTWGWPMEGAVERDFRPDVPGRKGIQIGGKLGQFVRAASTGKVVYSGSGLPGYGRLIIVKHSETYLSAYGYLGKILVEEGDRVEIGQTIAELGSSNENRPMLHFEIRQDGEPVNPLRFLPS